MCSFHYHSPLCSITFILSFHTHYTMVRSILLQRLRMVFSRKLIQIILSLIFAVCATIKNSFGDLKKKEEKIAHMMAWVDQTYIVHFLHLGWALELFESSFCVISISNTSLLFGIRRLVSSSQLTDNHQKAHNSPFFFDVAFPLNYALGFMFNTKLL